ncbi:putative sulfatase [Pedobacter sp. BAL39]|nr:putative sulfatase [Pedobacter sp. BAL39]
MLKSLFFLLRIFVFWLLYFGLDRLIFIIIFYKKIAMIPFKEVMATFYHALLLDLSMTAYIAVIPLLGYIFWLLSGRKSVTLSWINVYNLTLIAFFSIISVINFNIYREWGSKVNSKALGFAIDSPTVAIASSASSPIGLSIAALLMLIVISYFLHKLVVTNKITLSSSPIWLRALVALLLIALNVMILRGGFRGSPITQSMAYFSEDQTLNNAAVNTEWNLMRSVLSARMANKNPYVYLSNQQADAIIKDLYAVKKDTTINILKTKRPNVVMVIIESFTADVTKTLGQEEGITPHMDSLFKKGVLFSKIYASGYRTDKGILATAAGYPTFASGSIVKWPEKMQKIPAIAQSLYRNGYETSFYYGGESEFDNYKAFILGHNYQHLVDRKDFKSDNMQSIWGKFDEAVFARQVADLGKMKQPFFSTTMTLTNHEPFTLPRKPKFPGDDNPSKFKSTANYTDSCINAFLNNARKKDWYKNTLFIFVADHGHGLPKNAYEIFMPQRYHIPLLFYGDVIKDEFIGKDFSNVGSQADIAATLLAQLDIPATEFVWSKNMLNPYVKPFAFFSWENGMGFIDQQQCVTFDTVGNVVAYDSDAENKQQSALTLSYAKACLQKIYQQFIEL